MRERKIERGKGLEKEKCRKWKVQEGKREREKKGIWLRGGNILNCTSYWKKALHVRKFEHILCVFLYTKMVIHTHKHLYNTRIRTSLHTIHKHTQIYDNERTFRYTFKQRITTIHKVKIRQIYVLCCCYYKNLGRLAFLLIQTTLNSHIYH